VASDEVDRALLQSRHAEFLQREVESQTGAPEWAPGRELKSIQVAEERTVKRLM
jgi:hypothetical protein